MKTGKKFSIRNQNCYTLCKEYFDDIKLPDIPYKKLSPEKFLEIAVDNGFSLIFDIRDVKEGDVFITNAPTHLMIYQDNNMILHHPIKLLSRKESITQEMISDIKYIIRRDK